MQLLAHNPSKLLVTGNSGTGKSTYFTRYVLNSKHPWKFIFDHEGEFQQRLDCGAAYSLEDAADSLEAGKWTIYDPSEEFPGDTPTAFERWCKWCFEASKDLPGLKLFACDELQKLVGTNTITQSLACILETGRRRGVDCAMIAQQPNTIHNRVREQITEVVAFQQLTENAVAFLKDVGFDPDRVRALKPGEYLLKNLRHGKEDAGRIF